MKMKQLFAICGMAAALICGASAVYAQDNGGPGGGFGGGRGNFDPAQFQQRMMDGIRDQLELPMTPIGTRCSRWCKGSWTPAATPVRAREWG